MIDVQVSFRQIGWALILLVLGFGLGCTIFSPLTLVIGSATLMLIVGILLVVTPRIRIER